MSEADAVFLGLYARYRLDLDTLKDVADALRDSNSLGGILALTAVKRRIIGGGT